MTALTDEHFLRRAIALSETAVTYGGRPFGAVVVGGDGQIVSQAQAVPNVNPRDWTSHSELQALRAASALLTWDALGGATLYASAEPCPMCAAAVYWCNIRRVVFSVGEPEMRAMRDQYERAAGIAMRCQEIFSRCNRPIEVIGPLLEEEGLAVHRSFWRQAKADV